MRANSPATIVLSTAKPAPSSVSMNARWDAASRSSDRETAALTQLILEVFRLNSSLIAVERRPKPQGVGEGHWREGCCLGGHRTEDGKREVRASALEY